jgi:hypothetical protein
MTSCGPWYENGINVITKTTLTLATFKITLCYDRKQKRMACKLLYRKSYRFQSRV